MSYYTTYFSTVLLITSQHLCFLMDYKEKFRDLVEEIKSRVRRENDKPLRNEDIARRLGYDRTYFSELMGARGKVTADHVRTLEREFSDDLNVLNEDEPEYLHLKNKYIRLLERQAEDREYIHKLETTINEVHEIQKVLFARVAAGQGLATELFGELLKQPEKDLERRFLNKWHEQIRAMQTTDNYFSLNI